MFTFAHNYDLLLIIYLSFAINFFLFCPSLSFFLSSCLIFSYCYYYCFIYLIFSCYLHFLMRCNPDVRTIDCIDCTYLFIVMGGMRCEDKQGLLQ